MIVDPMFPGYAVRPIAEAPRDGSFVMVREGSHYAGAHWRDDFWLLGRAETGTMLPLEFAPSHWLRPPPQ